MTREVKLSDFLYDALAAAIPEGSTIPTISDGRPNRITRITRDGVYVATAKSQADGKAAQLVPAWMIEVAWNYLEQHSSLTNEHLLSTDGLNVKRSSAVCAILARLPQVRVVSTRTPIKLEIAR